MNLKGKCSWFGGPDDGGVSASEDLAFIYSIEDQPDLFLPEQPPGTTGLARRLDPDEFYVACRWPYNSETKAQWREALLARKALVRNPRNGKRAWAFPADWGPHEDTDRVADLSQSLLEFLELTTDDDVQVLFPTRRVTLPIRPEERGAPYPFIVISPGHGLLIRGAEGPEPWGLDEVDQARRMVPELAHLLRKEGVNVLEIYDDTSTTQDENLNYLVSAHNAAEGHDLDISVHLNAAEPTTVQPRGCEVYAIAAMDLAADVSLAMADAGDLIDRGAKDGSGLFFCNHTQAESLLLELAFVDSKPDVEAFLENFHAIAQAIADVLRGKHVTLAK